MTDRLSDRLRLLAPRTGGGLGWVLEAADLIDELEVAIDAIRHAYGVADWAEVRDALAALRTTKEGEGE